MKKTSLFKKKGQESQVRNHRCTNRRNETRAKSLDPRGVNWCRNCMRWH